MELPNVAAFERVVFFTGAGMSAESGVPTYRGKGGIWGQYRPEDYASQRAFLRDPEQVWDFHDLRRKSTMACQPHRGHELIAEIQRRQPTTKIVTQNIDGMHQRAGSTDVIELHGTMWHVRCDQVGERVFNDEVPIGSRKHPSGHYWRPDIVWFGDMLSPVTIERAIAAISECDLLVSIGTSAVVYPAADMPLIAKRRGALLVEVNPEETPLSDAYDVHLRVPASEGVAILCGGER